MFRKLTSPLSVSILTMVLTAVSPLLPPPPAALSPAKKVEICLTILFLKKIFYVLSGAMACSHTLYNAVFLSGRISLCVMPFCPAV
jgi:hypothetical protein